MKDNLRLARMNVHLIGEHRRMYKKLKQAQAIGLELHPEPEPERVITPTPSENDWMDVGDNGNMPDVSPSLSIIPVVVTGVPALYEVAKHICFFCGKNLTLAPRKMRIRHKSRCKKKQPLYYH